MVWCLLGGFWGRVEERGGEVKGWEWEWECWDEEVAVVGMGVVGRDIGSCGLKVGRK